jgi:para-aminobenzoate synthetase component 1
LPENHEIPDFISLRPEMKKQFEHIIGEMNALGSARVPFVFLIDFDFEEPRIWDLKESPGEILWQTPSTRNFPEQMVPGNSPDWHVEPVRFDHYQQAFDVVSAHIHQGDTYLLNLTMPSRVKTSFSPEELFFRSCAPYKIWLKDRFLCFSPEIFVRINDGLISSFPMKGTIDANLENAYERLLNDPKETAEHHTIVDLIRNDLSLVATNVHVKRFRYIERIRTNRRDLLQMSSEIEGRLPDDFRENIGTIIAKMLPAGSICGAPKRKTVEIIRKAEQYKRGYYTGIFGVFDGQNLDSCVLIRFIELDGGTMTFKSGGGITFQSDCLSEYNELIQKIYVPIG